MFTDSKHQCRFEEDGTDGALKLSQINEHNSSSIVEVSAPVTQTIDFLLSDD